MMRKQILLAASGTIDSFFSGINGLRR